jgi:hypothetical protein
VFVPAEEEIDNDVKGHNNCKNFIVIGKMINSFFTLLSQAMVLDAI